MAGAESGRPRNLAFHAHAHIVPLKSVTVRSSAARVKLMSPDALGAALLRACQGLPTLAHAPAGHCLG